MPRSNHPTGIILAHLKIHPIHQFHQFIHSFSPIIRFFPSFYTAPPQIPSTMKPHLGSPGGARGKHHIQQLRRLQRRRRQGELQRLQRLLEVAVQVQDLVPSPTPGLKHLEIHTSHGLDWMIFVGKPTSKDGSVGGDVGRFHGKCQ